MKPKRMMIKPHVVEVIEDDGRWLDPKTMTYYDKDELVEAPAGIDEAAERIVVSLVPTLGQKYEDGSYVQGTRDYFSRDELIGLVKAGAEWMAGQGVTCEFEVYLDSLKTPDGTLYEYPACYMKLPGGVAGTYVVPETGFKEGDEVVVQIRKK